MHVSDPRFTGIGERLNITAITYSVILWITAEILELIHATCRVFDTVQLLVQINRFRALFVDSE